MQLRYVAASAITTMGVLLATSVGAASLDQTQYDEVTVKKLKAKTALIQQGKKAAAYKKGARAFKVKDDLVVTGKVTIKKKLDVRGVITDTSDETVTVKDNLVPKTTGEYDLGSAELVWDNLYVNAILATTVDGVDVSDLADRVTSLESATDNDTTYTAGTGLTLSGTEFSSTLGTAIDSSEITDGTITTADLADESVTADIIEDETISAAQLRTDSVDNDEITNVSRRIPFQIGGMTTIEGATPQVLSVSTTPNLNQSAEGAGEVVEWVSGDNGSDQFISANFMVPSDYVGSGTIHAVVERTTSDGSNDTLLVNWLATDMSEDFSTVTAGSDSATLLSFISTGFSRNVSVELDDQTLEADDIVQFEFGFSEISNTWHLYSLWFEYEAER